MTLRDYQESDVQEIRMLYREGHRRVLLVQPTGSGKGVICAYIVQSASQRGKRIQFWVNRRTLVHDMSERLERLGLDHGVIMANTQRRKPWLPVQVASIDTLRNREQPPPADLIVIDECLTGDTLVLTEDGEIPISDKSIVGKKAISYDERSKSWVKSSIVGWIRRPIKNVLLVRIGRRSLQCTSNHLFLTTRGWIPADSLRTSDLVYTPVRNQYPCVNTGLYSEPFSVTRQSDSHTKSADTRDYTVTMETSRRSGQNTKPQGSPHFKLGSGKPKMEDGEKLTYGPVPVTTRGYLRSFKQSSLMGLKSLASIGWIQSRMRGWLGGTWTTGACRLAREVVRSFTSTLKVFHGTRVLSFATGFPLNTYVRKFSETEKNTLLSLSMQTPLATGCDIGENTQSPQWITSFERVLSVEPEGEEPVYDIEVEATHNFVANGSLVHNCHFAVSDGWKQMMTKYPNARFLLMTATPIRLDGRGLEEIADVMVMGPSVQTLIDQGYLVPSVVYAPPSPEALSVKKFTDKEMSSLLDKNRIIGDIVKTWLYRSAERKSVTFAVDKAHAEHIAEEFRCAGVSATTVTDVTPDDERARIWKDFDHGTLRMVTSVGVISYGWDHPICSTVVLARPTDSLGLFLQQVGRGCRPAPGKDHLLVLDHAGNTVRHGMYEDEREWSLSGGCINKRKIDDAPSVTFCRACFLTFRPGPDRCPACGVAIVKHKRTVEVMEGHLEEVRREVKAKRVEEWRATTSQQERMRMFLDWKRISKERGYSHRWPYAKYNVIFGEGVPKEFAGMR